MVMIPSGNDEHAEAARNNVPAISLIKNPSVRRVAAAGCIKHSRVPALLTAIAATRANYAAA